MLEPIIIGNATLLQGDCLAVLATLPDNSVHCCVTSPPYFGLRDYGHPDQIGLEDSPDAYVTKMVSVFREVRRVLRDDGTCWINIGDSYANGGRKTRDQDDKLEHRGMDCRPDDPAGIKPKDLIGIPWLLAFALRADGWYLRQDIIWAKLNPMPESVTDRCTKAHEYVFLLTKSPRYFWDVTAMQEAGIKGAAGSLFYAGKTADHQLGRASTKPRKQNSTNDSFVPGASEHSGLHRIGSDREPETRNRRSVWSIASQPYDGAHFAVMPKKLVEPCILAGCPVGGTVLDPFNGAATVGIVALEHGRQYLGIELNPEYVGLSVGRLTDATRQGQLFSLPPIPRPAPSAQQVQLFEAA